MLTMMNSGRNDPCPCGSGKKFKKCCGLLSAPGSFAYTEEERASAFKKLHRFAEREEFEGELRASWEMFWGTTLDVTDLKERSNLLSTEIVHVNLSAFHHLDRGIRDGCALLELLLEAQDVSLAPGERQFLEALSETHLRIYEIQDVSRGEGVRLSNLWREEEAIWVHEKLGTRHVSRWDLLAARVMQRPSGKYVFEGDMYPYPARTKGVILENLRREYKRQRRTTPDLSDRAYFKRAASLFNQMWMRNVAFAPPPKVVTAEGDPVVLARVTFVVLDPSALTEALNECPDLRGEDEGCWTWNEKAKDDAWRILGRIDLKHNRLVLDTTSRQRARRGRKLIERLASGAVRYLDAEYVVPDVLSKRMGMMAREGVPEQPLPREDPGLPDVTRMSIEAQLMDEAHHRWIDEPVPLLGNRTPRHAARLRSLRPKLIDLIKEFENAEEHKALNGETPYDFGWMWRELGLDLPTKG